MVSHYVNRDPDGRLNYADNQHSDVLAAFPESPTEPRDNGPGHEENQEEAEDVISVIDVGTKSSRCKKMSEEADANEQYAEPGVERFRRARRVSGLHVASSRMATPVQ